MQKLMNLLTVVILLGGGYLVYQKWSSQQQDSESAPVQRPPQQAAAQPAPQQAPAPTTPPPAAPAAPAAPEQTASTPAPAAAPANPSAPAADTNAAAAVSSNVMPAPVATDVMPTPPSAAPQSNTPAPAATVASTTTPPPAAAPAAPETPAQPTAPPPATLRPIGASPVVIGGQTASTQPQVEHKPFRELKPADYVSSLPPQAVAAYVQARAAAGQGGTGSMALRSWMSIWLNRMRDPQKAMVELDFANLVLNGNERYVNEQVAAAAQQQNARTAKNIISAIRKRNILDEDLLAELSKTEAAADQRLTTFK